MKKFLFIGFFILIFNLSYCPIVDKTNWNLWNSTKIIYDNPYLDIYNAIAMVESKMNPLAYNPKERAVGILQIRQIRINDYNLLTGKSYKLKDAYDVEVSKEIFFYYAEKIGIENQDLIIRKWNGSGPMTYKYLEKVKRYLSLDSSSITPS